MKMQSVLNYMTSQPVGLSEMPFQLHGLLSGVMASARFHFMAAVFDVRASTQPQPAFSAFSHALSFSLLAAAYIDISFRRFKAGDDDSVERHADASIFDDMAATTTCSFASANSQAIDALLVLSPQMMLLMMIWGVRFNTLGYAISASPAISASFLQRGK